jgi:Raf kinase inhibitor-like YbhB/YbcL family protein
MQKMMMVLLALLLASPLYARPLTLNSTSFNDREKLEPVYTCSGKNISPELEWNNVPAKTVSLALILSDPDAPDGTFYHWVLYNIPPSTQSLPKNIKSLPRGSITGKNSWDKSQYSGPCPPKGKLHHYIFSLYALDTKLDLQNDADAKAVLNAVQNHVLGEAELKAVFKR